MMKVVTSQEMQKLDKLAIKRIGIPSIVLMENAGIKVTEVIEKECGPLCAKSVYILCGPGNNGGDGMVVARHLLNRGVKMKVFLLARKNRIKGDAATNLDIAEKLGIGVKEVTSARDLRLLHRELPNADIIVDALLGTGSTLPLRGLLREAVGLINQSSGHSIAIDLPTGLHADTGEVPGEAVKANITVTFAYPKRGLYLYPGINYAGKIEVVDIGIPSRLGVEKIRCNLLTSSDVKKDLFYRKPSSHKGNFGHLLIIAGSPGMTGAATLTARAALRVGAGLVTLGIPESLNPILEIKLTEVMTLPLPETPKKTLSSKAFEKIKEFTGRCRAMALGPGISVDPETKKLVKMIMAGLSTPLVLDADGINNLAGEVSLLQQYPAPLIITPHPGEMSRLLEIEVAEVQKDRVESTMALARLTGAIAVLKGAGTIIANKEGESWINSTGNPGMASGGTGDVLTGIIGGLLVQEFSPLLAAQIGVYLHGLAGDLAAQKKGETSLIAGDVLENLPEAIRRVKSEYC
ncbi:MAG: NAD(P)H-hydrate dehydratase [bacterium]